GNIGYGELSHELFQRIDLGIHVQRAIRMPWMQYSLSNHLLSFAVPEKDRDVFRRSGTVKCWR
ncbi:MAG: hypothetical protein QF773_08110, partial [Lentisphaeria bacterium]|nr:hypothetical protein [Lentisphaeria bacterium]